MNGIGSISPSNVTDFSSAAKIFTLLLAVQCVVINFTILFKLLMKPHLWSILNALICILLSKSTSTVSPQKKIFYQTVVMGKSVKDLCKLKIKDA